MRMALIGAVVVAAACAVGVARAETTATAVVCTGVENREPVGAAESFPASVGSLYCFSEVRDGAGKVVHVWIYRDSEMATIELAVQGERWRTWSKKQIVRSLSGPWRIEVRAEDGTVLAAASFTIE